MVLHPGFHPGLLIFNPFRIGQAGKTLSITPTDFPTHTVVEIYRLDPGLLIFNPFRIVNSEKAWSITPTDPLSSKWLKFQGCTHGY